MASFCIFLTLLSEKKSHLPTYIRELHTTSALNACEFYPVLGEVRVSE